ncbi:hypothetical protein MAR_038455 [Mya arenaria]|uniref:Uncharacterized protein n=1 Tax=Mya arenaria TaxID=6604 RepID=A0ABY7FVM5_MYAAR|nr:hypothetical protein MAR_038455 [Mya arenaria]
MESWGKFLQTFTAITTDEVLNTPLFGNHIIIFKSKPLFIANFSKSGIKRIKDVWDLTKSDYVSTENLLSKLKSKQNWIAEWTMIKKSIPKAVIDTLKCGGLESTQNVPWMVSIHFRLGDRLEAGTQDSLTRHILISDQLIQACMYKVNGLIQIR